MKPFITKRDLSTWQCSLVRTPSYPIITRTCQHSHAEGNMIGVNLTVTCTMAAPACDRKPNLIQTFFFFFFYSSPLPPLFLFFSSASPTLRVQSLSVFPFYAWSHPSLTADRRQIRRNDNTVSCLKDSTNENFEIRRYGGWLLEILSSLARRADAASALCTIVLIGN